MEEEKPISKKEEKVLSTLEQVKAENERLEKNLERKEELIRKEEELKAETLLSGNSDAPKPEEEKKEETPAEYAKRVSSGNLNG